MTGAEIQARLDALVLDLQTNGKGQSITVGLRNEDNVLADFPLSSDIDGVVNAGQLAAIQNAIDAIKPIADDYELEYGPVKDASEAFRTARGVHQALIDAASAARTALNDALEADVDYQAAKTAYDNARLDPDYVAARTAYKTNNVSENYGNLQEAKGKYEI